MHVVTDEEQIQEKDKWPLEEKKATPPKLTRNQFRFIAGKETMINGKAFEDCSRMELFDMIMSLIRNVGILHKQVTELKAKYEPKEELPITEDMAKEVLKVVDELMPEETELELEGETNSRYTNQIEEAEIVDPKEDAPEDVA